MENNNQINAMNLKKEEQVILKIAIDEYNDLFPKILEISKQDFLPTLEKYIEISLIPKNLNPESRILNKILQIIQNEYYEPECDRINQIIHSINNISTCDKFNGNNFIPHCNHFSEPIHSCGNKMFILDDMNYLLCLGCKKIYHSNFVLFHCNHCSCDYYTSIEKKMENEVFKPATWEKYHCNAVINDVMKCPKCKSYLYINQQNDNLICLKCGLELGQFNIKWKCIICRKEFTSAAKVYNPYEFKLMKIAIKDAIFNEKEAKPDYIPCCNISKNEIQNYEFQHKKECDGLLYEGELNKKKIIVCSKCHMLNFYEFHKWMCPLCKERFLCKNIKDDDEEDRNFIMRKKSNLFPKTAFSDAKRDFSQSRINDQKLENNNLYKSAYVGRSRGYSSNNLTREYSQYEDRETNDISRNVSDFNLDKEENNNNNNNQNISVNSFKNKTKTPIKKVDFHDRDNSEIYLRKMSNNNININLNVNVNINNSNNNKIPYPYRFPKSSKNLQTYNYLNQKKEITSEPNTNFNSDDYIILSQIGEGTFGKIYQVESKNHQKYAMKKILANSEKEINVLEKEYNMLLDLSPYHLNLVNIHGIETKKLDKTTYVMYVLMDLAVSDWEKEIMQRKAKKNYYKEEELFIILKELVHTFAELQRHKISHRDIKPQNILLFPDKSFRIADFGEAKEMMTNNRATVKQTIRGTELYMSPILFHALQEKGKIKCAEHNAFKSDVFSLGLCLLFAATLTFNSLCDIRELNNTISMKLALKNYLKRYSMKFTDILFSMLEFDEKYRDDFIELDKRIEYL